MLKALEHTVIVTGHYGSGKTNLSGNIALDFRRSGEEAALADLDIVNPYFRSADFRQLADENGIELLASAYAGSNLDIPSLTMGLDGRLDPGRRLVIDVGGDDAGAFALGRYSRRIAEHPYTMLYVVNCFRYLTREAREAVVLLHEIEKASRLNATHICNNSNLAGLTTREDILRSLEFADEVANLTGLPLLFTSVNRELVSELSDLDRIYPVDIMVKLPWN